VEERHRVAFEVHLLEGFDEEHVLVVADGAADLDEDEFGLGVLLDLADAADDLFGDMRRPCLIGLKKNWRRARLNKNARNRTLS
jgi:hypothetical protein